MIQQRLFVRILIVMAIVSSLLVTGATGRDRPALAATLPPVPRLTHPIEITRLRNAISRTFLLPSGALTKRIYAQPINYRASNGVWHTIDNTLIPAKRAGYAFRNRANAYHVLLPRTLRSRPIRVSKGNYWLAFTPVGAYGAVHLKGTGAAYAGRHTSIDYTADNTGVKESIRLDDPRASSAYSYRLSLGPGLRTEQATNRTINVLETNGNVVFQISAPIMTDAAGHESRALALTARRHGSAETLTLSASRPWLHARDRRYPVIIDPTTTANFAADQSCTIASGYGSSSCGQVSSFNVGQGSTTDESLFQFDLQGAAGSEITSAQLHLYVTSVPRGSFTVSAYQITHSWDATKVTWNTYDGTNSWTAGGDIAATALSSNIITGPSGPSGAWFTWDVTSLAQQWGNGTTANNGVLMKEPSQQGAVAQQGPDTPGPSDPYVTFAGTSSSNVAPYLAVTYLPGAGDSGFYTFYKHQIDDQMGLAVNVANGNLMVSAKDVSLPGVGLPLSIARAYNSAAPALSDLGNGWTMSTGHDVYLQPLADGDVIFHDGTGYEAWFQAQPYNQTNPFLSPPGVDASLTGSTSSGFTLTMNQTQEKVAFSGAGVLLTDTDRSGNKLAFNYNPNGTLASIVDTQGRTTSVSYNAQGLISQITDPAGRIYSYGYDASNNLTSYKDPDGYTTSFSYTGSLLTQIVDPDGHTTTIAYDSSNRVASITYVTNPGNQTGPTETFTYNSDGTTTVTDSSNHATTYTVNASGAVTAVKDANGNTWSYTYSSDMAPSSSTTPMNEKTTVNYDGSNNVASVDWPTGGASQSYTYGSSQWPYQPTAETDAQGNTTTYSYDSLGRTKATYDGARNETTYTYNANGTVATMTNVGTGRTTTYQYFANGLLSEVDYPGGGKETYTYTSANLVATKTDGNGNVAAYTYDNDGRTTGISYTGGASVTYVYDGDGNTLSETDSTGTTTYTLNALGQVTQESLPGGATITYTWDGEGNLLTKTDSGGTVTYTYTPTNQIATVADPSGTTTFGYNADGETTSLTYPNGVNEVMRYDSDGHLTSIGASKAGTTLTNFAYSYTNPTTKTIQDLRYSMSDAGGNATNYTYDADSRLTQAVETNNGTQVASYGYAYDAGNDMTSQTINGTTTPMTYNGAGQLTQMGSTSFTYDGAGNQAAITGGATFAYNTQEQTTSITPNGGSPIQMTYAGTGQTDRIGRGSDSFQSDATGISQETSVGSTSYFTRTPGGQLIDERTSSGTYYYLLDGQGSVVGLINSSGSLVNHYSYDPYGNITNRVEGASNPFLWIGSVYDTATGLYKLGARYYNPQTASFTQPDGQCEQGCSGSAYAYGSGDPINVEDPTGQMDFELGTSYSLLPTDEEVVWGVGVIPAPVDDPSCGQGCNVTFTWSGVTVWLSQVNLWVLAAGTGTAGGILAGIAISTGPPGWVIAAGVVIAVSDFTHLAASCKGGASFFFSWWGLADDLAQNPVVPTVHCWH